MPGPTALTDAWQAELTAHDLRQGLLPPISTVGQAVFVPNAGGSAVAPLGFQQQVAAVVSANVSQQLQQQHQQHQQQLQQQHQQHQQHQQQLQQFLQQMTSLLSSSQTVQHGQLPAAKRQLLLASPQQQTAAQPPAPSQLRSPRPLLPLADGTVLVPPPAIPTSPPPEPTGPAGPGLPPLGTFTSLLVLCTVWYQGATGQSPLKDLPASQRPRKQAWSEWCRFFSHVERLCKERSCTVDKAAEIMELERADMCAQRAAKAAQEKKRKPPVLTVAGYVGIKVGKRS